MEKNSHSRRGILALAGSVAASGCSSFRGSDPSDRLPVLVGLSVHNDTDQVHEYRIQVQYDADSGREPAMVFQSEGAVRGRAEIAIEDDWSKKPGQYTVGLSVDGGDWHNQDITDRLTQRERICYTQEVSITDNGNAVTFGTNLNAPCPRQ